MLRMTNTTEHDPTDGYAMACARAAEAQGITAIRTELAASGIACEEWQTGGMCMAAAFRFPGHYVMMTREDGEPGSYIVGLYTDDDEQEPIDWRTLTDLGTVANVIDRWASEYAR